MPDKKISQLTEAGTLTGTEELPIVQNGETVKTTIQDVANFGSGSNIDTGSFATTGSNTFIGEQTISGSIQISGSIIPSTDGISTTSSFSLGSATNAWKDIWVSNGTINFVDGAGNVQAALSSTEQGLTLPQSLDLSGSAIQSVSASSGDGSGLSTLELKPDSSLGSDQYIVLDPTAPNHIHIRAGGTIDESSADLYVGGEANYVRVSDSGDSITINSDRIFNINQYYFYPGSSYSSAEWYTDEFGNHKIVINDPTTDVYDAVWAFNPPSILAVTSGGNYNGELQIIGTSTPGWPAAVTITVAQEPSTNPIVVDELYFEINQSRNSQIRLNSDIEIEASDDLRLYSYDRLRLINYADDEAIEITTDHNDDSYTWYFNSNGTLDTPGDVDINGSLEQGSSVLANGNFSHAEGESNEAIGDYSHAEGYQTQAIGNYSHTEGQNTIASGSYSHAEGSGSKAIGDYSHAEGRLTSAIGTFSHAEGIGNEAIGDYSHAEGGGFSIGDTINLENLYEFKFGVSSADNTIVGDIISYSPNTIVAENDYSSTPVPFVCNYFEIDDDNNDFDINPLFYPAPTITNVTYDSDSNSSTFTFENLLDSYTQYIVSSNQAIGSGSHAEGLGTYTGISQGYYLDSVINGVLTLSASYGDESFYFSGGDAVILYDSTNFITQARYIVNNSYFDSNNTIIELTQTDVNAPSGSSVVSQQLFGNGDQIIPGNHSHAEGGYTYTMGPFSHAEGIANYSLGDHSHTEGQGNITMGPGSHAEGLNTVAIGNYSHTEGQNTKTIGGISHAEGFYTQAVGIGSHAEGYYTIASGSYSHAEGDNTLAQGDYSHTEGSGSKTIGDYSHAEGEDTKTGTQNAYSASVVNGIVTLNSSYGNQLIYSFAGTPQFNVNNRLYLYDTPFDGNYNREIFIISQSYFSGGNTIVELEDTSVNTTTAYVGDVNFSATSWNGDQTIPGDYSHTEGDNAIAIGKWSHAEGIASIAVGESSHAEGVDAVAIGDYSHAEGANTKAIGYASHAEGLTTQAIGDYSHAEGANYDGYAPKALGLGSHAEGGGNTQAIGDYSHAEGSNTQTIGNYSHAEGINTQAIGEGSHAEGISIIASGSYSHAEGSNTQAIGEASHAEGYDTQAIGNYSHTEGYQTQAVGYASHAEGSNTLASGSYSHAEGDGTQAIGDHSHAEGKASSTQGQWSHAEGNNTQAIGTTSHAEGIETQAIGEDSHAEGANTQAVGYASHAEGSNTLASGSYSHAEGEDTTTIGDYSHAEGGDETIALGSYSHAEGRKTQAIGEYSHAEGRQTKTGTPNAYLSIDIKNGFLTLESTYGDITNQFEPNNKIFFTDEQGNNTYGKTFFIVSASSFDGSNTIIELTDSNINTDTAIVGSIDFGIVNWTGDQTIRGDYSHTEGFRTQVIGNYSHAEGYDAQVIGNYSHAEGINTQAIGEYSHAEGSNTQTIGNYSHAEGFQTITSGSYSHAEGEDTITLGEYSHAEGRLTQAIGYASHAEGFQTMSSGSYQHVSGKFNEHNNTGSLFIVGIGLDDESRKDGFTVDVDVEGKGSVMIPNNPTTSPLGQLLGAPANPKTGSMFVDPVRNKLFIYTGNDGIEGWVSSNLT